MRNISPEGWCYYLLVPSIEGNINKKQRKKRETKPKPKSETKNKIHSPTVVIMTRTHPQIIFVVVVSSVFALFSLVCRKRRRASWRHKMRQNELRYLRVGDSVNTARVHLCPAKKQRAGGKDSCVQQLGGHSEASASVAEGFHRERHFFAHRKKFGKAGAGRESNDKG